MRGQKRALNFYAVEGIFLRRRQDLNKTQEDKAITFKSITRPFLDGKLWPFGPFLKMQVWANRNLNINVEIFNEVILNEEAK